MAETDYDLAVCWRVYPGVSKSPAWFSDDKFRLAQLSFLSFLRSAEGLRIKYFILLDGCPVSFESIFTEQVSAGDIELIRTEKAGNQATFRMQRDILLKQQDAELVYFAEDDYLYRPGVFHQLVRFMQHNPDADFVTPYDHEDYYSHPIHAKPGLQKEWGGVKWKSVVATCLTFLTRRAVLQQVQPVLETYSRGNTDGSMWILLTRTFSIGDAFRFYFRNKTCFFMLKKAMKYSFKTFRNGKQYFLWCPVPAVGTHLESAFLAPGVNWEQVKDETIGAFST